jgi:hypothetical protein
LLTNNEGNRKRIADIGIKYNALSDEKKDQLITYAKEQAGVEVKGVSILTLPSSVW